MSFSSMFSLNNHSVPIMALDPGHGADIEQVTPRRDSILKDI
jgi:hypothetical protein